MQYDNLIPESAVRLNGDDVSDVKRGILKLISDIGLHRHRSIRVKSRLGSTLDFYRTADILGAFRGDARIPKQEALLVGVIGIGLHATGIGSKLSRLQYGVEQIAQLIAQRPVNKPLAGSSNGIEACCPLLVGAIA